MGGINKPPFCLSFMVWVTPTLLQDDSIFSWICYSHSFEWCFVLTLPYFGRESQDFRDVYFPIGVIFHDISKFQWLALCIPMLPKDRFSSLLSPLSQRTGLTKRLQFTQITRTGNYGKHQEPYSRAFHGPFTDFSGAFHCLFTFITISCNFIKIAQLHTG